MDKIKNVLFPIAIQEKMQKLHAIKNDDTTLKDLIDQIKVIRDSKMIIGGDLYNDLEFFQNFNDRKSSNTVFSCIDKTLLNGGKLLAQEILRNPIKDIRILESRKKILTNLETIHEDSELCFLRKNEASAIGMFSELDQTIKELYDSVYFKFNVFEKLNKHSGLLTAKNLWKIALSPVVGIISPIIYFIIPYLILVWKLKLRMPFVTYIKTLWWSMTRAQNIFMKSGNVQWIKWISWIFSIIFWFQGIINSVEISKTTFKISKHIGKHVDDVVTYLKSGLLLIDKYWKNDIIGNFIDDKTDILFSYDVEKLYVDSLKVKPFFLMNNFGNQLKTYKYLDKKIVKSILFKTYIIDALSSFVKYKKQNTLCFTNFIRANSPRLKIIDFYHPSLINDKVVKNSLILGGNKRSNIIITGSNAAGKSTLIKSLLISIVLSQTITISNSKYFDMTPYLHINSQINVPDVKGHESLFEAEMFRSKSNLEILKNYPNDEFHFILMDEIFSSTNPIEGISGAYSIAKKLGNYQNCTLIFTTHLLYLTRLANDTKKFKNYCINVNIDSNNNITFPYKLNKGISKQYIALELLKKNGFDKDIIDEAIKIKNDLLT